MVEILGKIEKADHAHQLYTLIVEAKNADTTRAIFLGQTFKKFRDDKLYNHLGYESFNEFIACPEIGYQRSTVYSYIRIWTKYVEEMGLDAEYLGEIGHKRLQTILPVVDKDRLEWLSRAQTWSYKDLLNQIRKEKGRAPMKKEEQCVSSLSPSYLEYVSGHGCIFHPARKSERAHFPRTDKAGGLEYHVIPLCHDCHMHYHDLGVVTFFEQYRNQLIPYFYNLIEKLYEELNARTL